MKRRAFISGTLSALSLTMIGNQQIRAQKSNIDIDKNVLERFVETFDFEFSNKCWSDSSFTLLYAKTSQSFQKSAYRLSEKRTYALPSTHLVMVALELNIADLGCIDWCFLFYEKCPDNQWQYVKALNKYEIEAILPLASPISNKLPVGSAPAFLLPRYSKQQRANGYNTEMGRIEIKINLHSEGIQSNVQIWNGEQHYSTAAV